MSYQERVDRTWEEYRERMGIPTFTHAFKWVGGDIPYQAVSPEYPHLHCFGVNEVAALRGLRFAIQRHHEKDGGGGNE